MTQNLKNASKLQVKSFTMKFSEYTLTAEDFEVEAGQYLTVEAPSGFGKTTLLRGILGLAPLSEGQIVLGGRELETLPTHQREFGVVFQDHLLFSHLNALDNALFGLKLRGKVTPQAQAEAKAAFQALGLESRMLAPIQELSGGERQRVALLRAMLFKPDALILDEPLKGLDAGLCAAVMAYLTQFLFAHPVPVIWVSHQGEDPLGGVRIVGKAQAGKRHFEFHRR